MRLTHSFLFKDEIFHCYIVSEILKLQHAKIPLLPYPKQPEYRKCIVLTGIFEAMGITCLQ